MAGRTWLKPWAVMTACALGFVARSAGAQTPAPQPLPSLPAPEPSTSTPTSTSTSTPTSTPASTSPKASPVPYEFEDAPLPAPVSPPAADKPAPTDPLYEKATRRSGVVFGLTLGAGILDVAGYPNSATHVDNPAFHHDSGALAANASRIFLMGALADTLNIGFWYGGMAGENDKTKAAAVGGGLRLEAFPLFNVSPKLRDLGVSASAGAGFAVADKKDKSLSVDGSQTFLGGGFLWELARGHFIGLAPTIGVTVEYQYVTSPSIESHGVFAGARAAFYGGP